MIHVLVADDHAMVREGLSSVLAADGDIRVVQAVADGAEAVEAVGTVEAPGAHEIDVVVMDLSMPVLDGVAATRAVLERRPQIRVLVLTSFSDRDRVRQAIAAGATGYQLKDAEPADLREAVRAVHAGHAPLDARVAGVLLPDPARETSVLSAREEEVLRLVATGRANKQVATSLAISERTVKAHLTNIYRQIGVADRTSAALWARDNLN